MELEIWSLSGSHFHFGDQGLGQENTRSFWSSDSLFAALIARLAVLRDPQAVETWVHPFLSRDVPFLITSLYPYAGEVLFFPIPLAAAIPDGKPLSAQIRPKELKRVQFVSEGLYRQLLQGQSLADLQSTAVKIQGGRVWLTQQERHKLPAQFRQGSEDRVWQIEKRPRVTVDRASNRGSLFHVGAVHFAKHCGLWFGAQWLKPSQFHQDWFATLLYDLGEAGLGAERSVGYGKGEFSRLGHLTFPDPLQAWTSLSRYLPRLEEMEAFRYQRAAWKIQSVGGWLVSSQKSGQRRRLINLVQEGATLGVPSDCSAPYGRLVDVRPRYPLGIEYPIQHPVYRCGLTVAVGYGGEA
ncbi:MAG: type III-A CRISPR-associated RAMP protein Csm4 [Anaerolineales bacterium]